VHGIDFHVHCLGFNILFNSEISGNVRQCKYKHWKDKKRRATGIGVRFVKKGTYINSLTA
jgi:hypothetical protein